MEDLVNPLKDVTEKATEALRAAGAYGTSAHPAVHYDRKRAIVTYFGGPPAVVVEQALEALVASGMLKSYTVTRYDQWSCGMSHTSKVDAWLAHEGSSHVVHVTDVRCDLGCDHGADYLPTDVLAELVEAGETFTSEVCRPLMWPEDWPTRT